MPILLLDRVPDHFGVEYSDGEVSCVIPVCECDQQPLVLTLEVKLTPERLFGPNGYEFAYEFGVTDPEGVDEVFTTQDRDIVERYLDGLPKDNILPTICAALAILVEAVQPVYIYRVTKGRSIPQKARTKHHIVTEALQGLGYDTIETGTDGFRRTFWLMAREAR